MSERGKRTDLFRKKSLERISSPENLDKYIKATTPSLWLLLISIIIILVGIIVWATVGKIDSASVIGCKVENGQMISYISENDYEKIKDDSYIEVDGKKYVITNVKGANLVDETSDKFLLQAANIASDAWYYIITCESNLADGKYKGRAVFEQISPIVFLVN